MMFCQDCKHWGEPPDENVPDREAFDGYRECRMGRVAYEEGDPPTSRGKVKRDAIVRHPRSLIAATGADPGFQSSVYTAPLFGCVHWDQ